MIGTVTAFSAKPYYPPVEPLLSAWSGIQFVPGRTTGTIALARMEIWDANLRAVLHQPITRMFINGIDVLASMYAERRQERERRRKNQRKRWLAGTDGKRFRGGRR